MSRTRTPLPPADPAAARERLRSLLGLSADAATTSVAGPHLVGAAEVRADGTPAEVLLRAAGAGAPEGAETADGAGSPHGAAATDIPALLLRPPPETATGAAVVLVAGHGRGIEDLVRTDPVDGYHDGLAHKLVRAGLTVLCPEMLGFGRRRVPRPEGAPPYQPEENSCGIDAAREILHGRTLMGRRVADARAAAQALGRLAGVDPERVAVAGGSGGGAVSLLLAATETSVAAALVATYFCTFEASLCSIRHCPCNLIPGVLPEFEMADIAALIAPRPLVIEAGERDHIFPISATRAAFARLAPAWEARGAVPPELVVTPGGHAFRAERSLEVLRERLG